MAVGKQIKVTLTLDENGFGSKTRSAAASVEQLGKSIDATGKSVQRIDNHLTSFGSKAHRMVMTLGMVRFALMDINDIFLKFPLAILKTSGEIERLTKLMEGLSTQTSDAAKKLEAAANVKFLFNMAQNAPFEVKALADSFVKLKTGGLDPTKGALQSLVDGVAKFGGSSEQLKRASIAIQQMGGKGVISMEELRQQLGEAVPTAMRSMADGMGMTMAELTKAVSKGTVEATGAMSKMLLVMGISNSGAAQEMMSTWVGMIERLKTKWELFKLDIGKSGMFDTAKAALQELIDTFGQSGTGNLARDIGTWLNSAVINVVALTKTIIELWDWIKMAGQAFAIYWVASKIAGPMMAAAKAVTDLRVAVVTNSRATLQAVADEGVARQRDAAARALHLRDWMAGNTAQITAERARVLAASTAADDILRKKIAANQTEILLAKDKAVALAAIEQQIRGQAMALELQAEAVARTKRAGSGAGSRVILSDAGRLAGNADILRAEREALLANAAAIASRNTAMEKSIEASKAAGVVNNSVTQSLTAKNNVLAQAVAKHEALAQNIVKVNSAASLMGGAMTAVGGFVKSMIFSLNGLIMIIMAAAYAWEYFSNKAKKAAEDAKNALNLAARNREGKTQQDNLDGTRSQIDRDKAQIVANTDRIAYFRRTREKAYESDIAALEQSNKRLLAKIGNSEADFAVGTKLVLDRAAEDSAAGINSVIDKDVTKGLKTLVDARQQAQKTYDEIPNKTPAQDKAWQAYSAKNTRDFLSANRAILDAKTAEYKELIKSGKGTELELLAFGHVLDKLAKDDAKISAQMAIEKSPVRILADKKDKKDKALGNDPTDGLLLKIDADAKFLLSAKAKMAGMSGDILDVAALRAQAQEEINQIMDQDRRLYTVHKPGDVEKAVEQLTNRKVMEEALREQSALFPRLAAGKERLRQLNEQVASGNFLEKGDNAEQNQILALIEKSKTMASEAALEVKQLIKIRQDSVKQGADIDLATATIAGEKSLREQRISGIVNDREKILAEGKQEVRDIQNKYALLIEGQTKHNNDVSVLQAQLTENLELQAKRQARALETPLEKLAIEWKDTTKAMGAASANAANGFVDMLVGGLEKGSLDIKGFLKSVLKDIASAQLKNSLADPLKQVFGAGGKMLSEALFGKTAKSDAAEANPLTDPLVAGAKAVASMAAKSLGAGDALSSMAKGGVSEAATAAAQSAISSATSSTASGSFTTAVTMATQAVTAFSTALRTNSGAGSGGAGGLGDISKGLFGGDWIAPGAQSSGAFTSAVSSSNVIGTALPPMFFADGGIMTDYGSIPLRKYARGGIAKSPQLAMYGEAGPEAYVPLPDGRSIPVTMQGSQAEAPSVTVNVINQSGQQVEAQRGAPRFDGKQMILDVVLTAANQPGGFRDGMKGAMR